jgi:hypothetical protein
MILSTELIDKYSQSSKSKHYVKAYFLLLLQLQLPDLLYRQSNNENILKDIDRAVCPRPSIEIDAFSSLDVFIPGVRYRPALEDCYQGKSNRACNAKYHRCPALISKSTCRKDFQVEDEDRDLDEAYCDNVENLANED